MLRLSVEECKEILEDVAEGVRMHHALRLVNRSIDDNILQWKLSRGIECIILRSECEENSNGINGNHNESGTSSE